MEHIVTVQGIVTAADDWAPFADVADFMEPTDAELDAIEQEMPLILARVDLLDAQIMTLDRAPTELDTRRIRRARRRVLVEGLALVNRTSAATLPGGAA